MMPTPAVGFKMEEPMSKAYSAPEAPRPPIKALPGIREDAKCEMSDEKTPADRYTAKLCSIEKLPDLVKEGKNECKAIILKPK